MMLTRGFAIALLALGISAGCSPTPPRSTSPAPPARISASVVCKIRAADCARAVQLVGATAPADVAAADAIVVADSCPPDSMCDRMWAFDSIVALARGGRLVGAYEVTGASGPEVVRGAVAVLPRHIDELVRATAATP
jgi:hypothetical protein